MTSLFIPRVSHRWLAAGVLALPLALAAQSARPVQETDWRRANDAVGSFKRGHVDVLRWEQSQPGSTATQEAPATGVALPTPETAVRMAWTVHRDLARPLARLGQQNVQWIAEGRWTALDPSLQWRIDDTGEVLEVAATARKAWIEAVAARQVLKHQLNMLEATQAAHELGQRMVAVGNWSKLQLTPLQLAESGARMSLRRAQLAAAQAQASLVRTMGQTGLNDGFVLPDQLPAVPAQPMPTTEWQQRAEAIRNQLPGAERLRSRALSTTAAQIYSTAHALAQESQGEILKTREFITEETVLHYNGMLKSVWDLLDEVRNQSQATVDAIGAQRDFWIAETDLQWVLQGGEPERFVSLGAAGADAPAAAAH